MRTASLAITVLLVGFTPCVFARQPVTAVVIMEGLTWQHIEQGQVGALYVLARHGAVGLMSVGRAKEVTTSFAATLQTGRRLALPQRASAALLKKRYPRRRWLMEDLARAGVEVQVHTEPSQESLQPLLVQPSPSPSSVAQVQIWWFRGSLTALSKGLERAIGSLNPETDRVLVIGLPPAGDQLAPVIMAGGGLPTGVLSSATTRTAGLVSDVDLAPTLRQWHGISTQFGEHPVRVIVEENAFSRVQWLAQQCRWNAQGLIPVGIAQVGGGLLAVLTAVRMIQRRTAARRTRLLLSVAIGALLSLPAGTVLAPHLPMGALWQYVGAILLSAFWLSLLAHWGAWDDPFRAYIRACALSVLVVLADVIGGQHGVKFSMYSAYALSGIRFYGVGNELMGVLVGCALAWGLYGLPALLRGILWAAVAVMLAVPVWGANMGGLLTSAVGLGCAWETARMKGKTLLRRCVGWFGVGLLAAIAVLWLDSLSASPSHAGEAWLHWRSEGWGALVDILSSKALLMVRVLLSPFTWGVLLAIGVALWRMRRIGVLPAFWNSDEYLPWLACIVAALVFNDSGFVPAAAILGVGVGALLTCKLQEAENGSAR
ncbi:MAG: hypothetical protein KatS3mg022_3491 [Armatimonadota bacterium]|nr:MAG: hypothetical protein KatS3mg022_3491 [Armatimonadota bacterium]